MSWEQLLSKIAGNYFVSPDTVKSSVLAFEQLKCTVLSKNIRLPSDSFAIEILQELDEINQDLYSAIFTEFLSLFP